MKRLFITMALLAFGTSSAFAADSSFIKLSLLDELALPSVSEVKGLELGLIYSKTEKMDGLQYTFIYSKAEKLRGVQVGFVTNAEKASGLQWGAVNIAKDMAGAQIGWVNYADKFTGFQFGLVNYTKRMESGVQIGLVNIITNSSLPGMVFANAKF